jgi:hypothetical protein
MRIQLFIISIFSLIVANTDISFAAAFGSCEENDPADPISYYDIMISSPEDLVLNTGLGIDATFNPDQIVISYDVTDTTCTTPIGYHAHNGDSTNYSSGEIEYNFTFLENSISNFEKVSDRSSSRFYSNRITSTFFIQFKDGYDVTVSDTLTTGEDPFDGQTNNAESQIKNILKLGNDTDLCQRISTIYDMSGVQYTEDNQKPDDVTQWKQIMSYKGYTSDTCPVEVEILTGSIFYGEMNIDNEELILSVVDNTMQWEVISTGYEYFEIPLYRNLSDIGDTNLIVINLRWTPNGFYFYNTDGTLIE